MKTNPPQGLVAVTQSLDWAFERKDWENLAEIFPHLHRALQRRNARLETWEREDSFKQTRGIYARTGWAFLQRNDPQRAVTALETGRAQELRESLEQQRQDLQNLPEDLYTRYTRIQQTIDFLLRLPNEKHPSDWSARLDEQYRLFDEILAQIRERDEFRYFLQSLPFKEIQRQAQDAPLVYLATTRYGGFALIVRAQGEPQAVDLPLLREQTLRERAGRYLQVYEQWLSLSMGFEIRTAYQKELDALLEWLGEAVMAPLLEALSGEERAVLIPGGWLGILPLHAARLPQGGYALDRMTFTYAPGAHALYHARQHQNTNGEHLLAVENPRGDLIFTPWEVRAARRYFPGRCTHLRGGEATLQAVEQALPEAGILHFSTHGSAGWGDSQRAALALANDESLSLKRVYALHLQRAQVAILSACETAVPGLKAPDEVLSLPAGWMLAGVPRVIGTLWAVNDLSTALLITRFFDLWQGAGKPIPEALREAQQWLRDTPLEKLRAYCRNYPDREVGQAFHRYLTLFKDSLDFAHPFYWAGFACVGLP